MERRVVRNGIVVAILAAFLLSLGAVAIPRPVAAQPLGPWADELIFSIVPQSQAVASVAAGDTDVYIFSLDQVTDVLNARTNPNVNTFEGVGASSRSLQFNPVPHGAGVPGFNPFTIRAIREAMYWAIDRDVILNDIYGGFGIKMWFNYHFLEPDYVRDAAFFAPLEAFYDFNPAKALEVITSEMTMVPGAALVNGKWQVNGEPVVVKIFHRTGDPRFETGIYVATVVDSLGFATQLVPGDFDAASDGPLFGDPTSGEWHIYTGGWLGGGFIQFDDGSSPFFYNGDLGTSIWDFYTPPPSLTTPCEKLRLSDYVNLDARRDLLRTCVTEGMKDGVRHFLQADQIALPVHKDTSKPTFDLFGGFLNSFSMKTARKGGVVGGSLRIAQPIHTQSPWNNWGGFADVYSENQHQQFSDVGVATHPHLGTVIPFRSDFVITTEGPTGTLSVPSDALTWDVGTSSFVPVGAGVTSRSMVNYTYTWGRWHHGLDITMDDVMHDLVMLFRFGETMGDLGLVSPSVQDLPGLRTFLTQFKGIKFTSADTVEIWIDSWNPDVTVIAGDGSIWPEYPWELNEVMARSALQFELSFHDTDARRLNKPGLDLVKGTASLASLSNSLAILKAANFRPAGLESAISVPEATARWAALDAWWTAKGHLLVGDGPFLVDSVSVIPEGTVMKAFRTGYPFDINKWEEFGEIRKPDVTVAAAPEVIQTFPATFSFTTTLQGQPYDLVSVANWLVSNPATRQVLFNGDAVRAAPGTWNVVLSAEQTTALVQGTYELKTIVVGEEAAVPVVTDTTFTSLSLATAIIAEVTQAVTDQLAQFDDTIAETTNTADAAAATANAALTLAYVVLGVAIAGIAVAVAGFVIMLRRLPPRG